MSPPAYYFGVEIELIATPIKIQYPTHRAHYYTKLAKALRSCGAKAISDSLEERYRKHPEHYDKWWITKDGSLGSPPSPQIPLEAVSPVFSTAKHWEADIDNFWQAWDKVFHMAEASHACGSHIHVSPSPRKRFSLANLKNIAYGAVLYEDCVQQCLPYFRRNNRYCRVNTEHADELSGMMGCCESAQCSLEQVWNRLRDAPSAESVRETMQASSAGGNDRYVVWNFDNILDGKSGTVEFRGGRGLRGPLKTKRWASFVLAFIHMCLSQHLYTSGPSSMNDFWRSLREAARQIHVQNNLPSDWRVMAELKSDGSYEEIADEDDAGNDSYDDDDMSILSKSDSGYSDSDSDDFEDSDDSDDSDAEFSDDEYHFYRTH